MDAVRCSECVALIGARFEENPHARLILMKYRRDKCAESLTHLAEFYKCSLCNTVLARDPLRLGKDSKLDWI